MEFGPQFFEDFDPTTADYDHSAYSFKRVDPDLQVRSAQTGSGKPNERGRYAARNPEYGGGENPRTSTRRRMRAVTKSSDFIPYRNPGQN